MKAIDAITKKEATLGIDDATMEMHYPDNFKKFGHPAYDSIWFSPTKERPYYEPPPRPGVLPYDSIGDIVAAITKMWNDSR